MSSESWIFHFSINTGSATLGIDGISNVERGCRIGSRRSGEATRRNSLCGKGVRLTISIAFATWNQGHHCLGPRRRGVRRMATLSSKAAETHLALVDQILACGALWSPALLAAFRATPRQLFLDRLWSQREGRWRL